MVFNWQCGAFDVLSQAPPQMPQYSAPPEAQHTQYSQAPPPYSLMPPHQVRLLYVKVEHGHGRQSENNPSVPPNSSNEIRWQYGMKLTSSDGIVQYDSYSQAPNAPPQTLQYRPPTAQQLPRMDSYGPPPPPPPPQTPFSAMPQLVPTALSTSCTVLHCISVLQPQPHALQTTALSNFSCWMLHCSSSSIVGVSGVLIMPVICHQKAVSRLCIVGV